MNRILSTAVLFTISFAAGCGNKAAIKPTEKKKVLLTVNFQEGKALKYRFVSEREIIVDWNPAAIKAENKDSIQNKSTEKLDLIMTYTPIEIDSNGLTTITAVCQNAQVRRSEGAQKDAAEYFAGKNYTFTIDSSGKIYDYSQLKELIKQTGQKAFNAGTDKNRIKEPDMIGDFIAAQWFMWDSIAGFPNASKRVSIGQNWTSKLSVPTPMVSRLARDVTYSLDEIRPVGNTNIAVISSRYSKSDSVPQSWPVPYTGSFQMRGTFGLLRGYKLLDLTGRGQELFNIDSGQIEEYNQQYYVAIQASVPIGISVKPVINIKQTISMTLIEE